MRGIDNGLIKYSPNAFQNIKKGSPNTLKCFKITLLNILQFFKICLNINRQSWDRLVWIEQYFLCPFTTDLFNNLVFIMTNMCRDLWRYLNFIGGNYNQYIINSVEDHTDTYNNIGVSVFLLDLLDYPMK